MFYVAQINSKRGLTKMNSKTKIFNLLCKYEEAGYTLSDLKAKDE